MQLYWIYPGHCSRITCVNARSAVFELTFHPWQSEFCEQRLTYVSVHGRFNQGEQQTTAAHAAASFTFTHFMCVYCFFFFTCERTHRFSVLTVTLLLTNSVEKCLSVCLCFGELCICMSKWAAKGFYQTPRSECMNVCVCLAYAFLIMEKVTFVSGQVQSDIDLWGSQSLTYM